MRIGQMRNFYIILLILELARLIKSIPIYRASWEKARNLFRRHFQVKKERKYNYK
jgi:hypothetical protein